MFKLERARPKQMSTYTLKLYLAVIGGVVTCFMLYVLLSLVTDYLYFTRIAQLTDFMDPESNAVELSKHTKYLVSVCLIWLVSISLSGFAIAKISTTNRFLASLISGATICAIYYAQLPGGHIIEIYPIWCIYSPLIMAVTAVFLGPAMLRDNHEHNN